MVSIRCTSSNGGSILTGTTVSILRVVEETYYSNHNGIIKNISSIVSKRAYSSGISSSVYPFSSTSLRTEPTTTSSHIFLSGIGRISPMNLRNPIQRRTTIPTSFSKNPSSFAVFARSPRKYYSSSIPVYEDNANTMEGKGRRQRRPTSRNPPPSSLSSIRTPTKTENDDKDDENKFVRLTRDEAKQLGILDELITKENSTAIGTDSFVSPSELTDIVRSRLYKGVLKDGKEATLWEAVIDINGKEISGGEYEAEEEAAKAYDALVRMYYSHLPNIEEKTNFPIDPNTVWVPPEEVITTGQIETKLGIPLTVEEIKRALEQERGINVQIVSLQGKSDLAEALIFVTGRSIVHMRKMADLVSRALRKRRLYGINPTVEARDADDWMVVDCGNIIVSVMDAEAREVFALEEFWNSMVIGQDPYQGMTHEEWLSKNPIPEKWIKRLEKDEIEFEAEKKLLAAPPQENKFHFRTKLEKSNKYGRKR